MTTRVMIVDDQPPFRSAARALIKRIKEFELVAEAESGEQAIEFAQQHRPHLVLMDINMGAVDGIEATRQITGALPATMIILVSTYGEDDLPARARGCGAWLCQQRRTDAPHRARALGPRRRTRVAATPAPRLAQAHDDPSKHRGGGH